MKSNKITLLTSCLFPLVSATGMAASTPSSKPNILIILVDDAGYNDFGFMGSKDLLTPNIDALAKEGVRFSDAHVAATVSSPSRACLITGRYGHRFGYECNLDKPGDGMDTREQTIGNLFQDHGYRTATIGKWHLGALPEMHPNQRGFDLFYGMIAGHREYFYNEKGSDQPGHEQNLQLNGKKVKFDGYLTDRFTDKSLEFINDSDQPFMLYLSYNAVHTPMQATQEDLARFKNHPRQKLAAMTWALDRGVGRIVQSLKETGKYDNTLIFFLSDNGGATINTSNNFPLKGFKGNKFEGGHRVPYFVVWNNHFPSNEEYHKLTSSLDIFATAADAAGIKKTKNPLDGVSLIPYLQGKKKTAPHDFLCWRKGDTKAIRDEQYKLIMTAGVDSVLYDMKNNVDEEINRINELPKVFKKLSKKLEKWEKDCIAPLWVETGWEELTNNIHKKLMKNEIRTYHDLYRKPKK